MTEGPLLAEYTGSDEWFGTALLRTDLGEVYSLDLYEVQDTQESALRAIAGGGYYLLPPSPAFEEEYLLLPTEVEFTVGVESLRILQMAIDNGGVDTFGRQEDLNGPFRGTLFLEWERDARVLNAVLSAPQRRNGRTAWTGGVQGHKPGSNDPHPYGMDFTIEQYGSIEPVLYLITLLYFTFDWASYRLRYRHPPLERCIDQALRVCGEGNVKSVSQSGDSSIGANFDVHMGVPTGASVARGGSCQFECWRLVSGS